MCDWQDGGAAGWIYQIATTDKYSDGTPMCNRGAAFNMRADADPQRFCVSVKLAAAKDGTSNTIAASETVQGYYTGSGINDLRGLLWYSTSSQFSTYLAPNSPEPDYFHDSFRQTSHDPKQAPLSGYMAVPGGNGKGVVMAARSNHSGGVNAAMLDASVRFISDSINIDTWRAASTTQNGETYNL